MGDSLTRKIIRSHMVKGSMVPGEDVFVKVDQTLTHDINAVMTYLGFEQLGIPTQVKTSVSHLDHNLLYIDFKTPDDHNYLRTIAEKTGVYVSRPGNGICQFLFLGYGSILFFHSKPSFTNYQYQATDIYLSII